MASTIPILLLNNGLPFPILGFGTGGREEAGHRSQIADAVYTAVAAGYRHIDTAWMYKVEKEVGEGIRKAITDGLCKREDIVVVTKVWPTNFTKDRLLKSAKESNEALGLGYIDVLLLHFPVPMRADMPGFPIPRHEDRTIAFDDSIDIYNETWVAMEELVDSGITKSIGISNFSSAQIETLMQTARIKPVVNQVECHPLLPQALPAHRLME